MLQVVDDALLSAAEAGKKTSKDADAKFKKAIDALSAFGKKYYFREPITHMMAEAEANDEPSLTTLERLEEIVCVRDYLTFSSPHTNRKNERRPAGRSAGNIEVRLWGWLQSAKISHELLDIPFHMKK